jgi:hypothetical protein
MSLIIGLKSILGWERLLLFGRYGYVEIIKCLMTKTLLFCRLSTGTPILSVYGRLFRGWRGGGSQPIYKGLCMFGGYDDGYFFFSIWVAA